jgi:ribosome-binding protein aMBF1 (putative translation factor)
MGVSQQMVAKFEDPDYHPSVEQMTRMADALGLRLRISVEKLSPARASIGKKASVATPQRKRRLTTKRTSHKGSAASAIR